MGWFLFFLSWRGAWFGVQRFSGCVRYVLFLWNQLKLTIEIFFHFLLDPAKSSVESSGGVLVDYCLHVYSGGFCLIVFLYFRGSFIFSLIDFTCLIILCIILFIVADCYSFSFSPSKTDLSLSCIFYVFSSCFSA